MVLSVALVAYVVGLVATVPPLEPLRDGPAPASRFMQASAERSGLEASAAPYAPLDELSPLLACAVVKAEDIRFFSHGGVDWPQLRLALGRGGRQGGASTISQQLARNLFLSPERTLHRKLRELVAAQRLEHTLGKRRILELYLNVIQLGPGVWGVRAASEHYFHTPPRDVDLFEAVFLASIIAAPNATLSGGNLERMLGTARRVLGSMFHSGLVTGAQRARVEEELNRFAGALRAGLPLHQALTVREAEGSPAADDRPPLPPDAALANDCGYEREVRRPATVLNRPTRPSP